MSHPTVTAGPVNPTAAAQPRPEPAGQEPTAPTGVLAAARRALPWSQRTWERSVWLWPALLTLAAVQFRANRAQLWRDEIATWSAATRSLAELRRMVVNIDAVSAPYYVLMHFWTEVFGDSVLALRAPSMLSMVAAAALTTLLGQRLFGTRAGLLAGALFALLPSTSRYAQEARAYALATLLAVLATLLLVLAMQRPGWWRWLAYGACVAALGTIHLIAATVVAGHAIGIAVALWRDRDARLLRWLPAVAGAGLLLLPLVLLGRGQQNRQLDWVQTPTGWDLPNLPGGVFLTSIVAGVVIGLAALAWGSHGRWAGLLGWSALMPAVLLFAGGLLTPLWVPRYLLFTVTLLCVLAGAALGTLRTRAALVIIVVIMLLGAPQQRGFRQNHEWPSRNWFNYEAALRVIDRNQQPGDAIVYADREDWAFLDLATRYHLREGAPRDVLLATDATQRGSLWSTECPQPAQCLADTERVWVFVRDKRPDPLVGMPRAKADALRDAFSTERVWHVSGLTVGLLVRDRP